ncbi:LuxR family transcriptional regulator [Streptomyces sp. DG2A-72]|uniref:LuxR family transcriptional regulator AbsR2 n=1 Tax=Streptomyces sp. DG2A-72 TaxID=3051386 RepID=UPI00265C19B0|nr:LuxR family transcriptional regulator [Streptomyces sp. DG2A-72]MDO0938473.1 LuxR family transcriptional regulator [Streptomyces sp. DG2A-72]
MTTYERNAKTLELPWPFTGRENELELIRRSLGASRHGIVVTGPAGCGKTRLVTEAVRGSDRAKAAGTPEARHIPFAAFAHLLPETVTLHKAVQLLSAVRTLLVDDAHLLDDASAALVHQLAVQGRTRLLVVATDDVPVPGAVSRLWTGELLPRLTLEPLPREETDRLAAAGAGNRLEPLTVNRLHRLCRGDLRLLRDLSGALREQGLLTAIPGSDERAWRGPVPLTATVRERTAHVIHRVDPDERETLELLAFADPLPPPADDFDLRVLERLETDGLIDIDDHGAVRLAHPLHGPVLRAMAGRLRARRLARTPDQCGPALKDEAVELARQIDEADVRTLWSPVGEWLVEEGEPVPADYAAVRARAVRLRGELREAAAWAREGLRESPDDPSCLLELTLAAAQSGEVTPAHEALTAPPATGEAATWLAAARGDIDSAVRSIAGDDVLALYDAVRLGAPGKTASRLPVDSAFAAHADALTRGDGPALDRAAERLQERGLMLFAAEAHAQAARSHRDPRAARTSRTRAVALARRCQGARTPALSGLVLGELTARQRQIVTLAAAGLTNRQIADRLTLSIRTVGNHLYSAYARLGASDRATLPCLLDAQPA